MASKPEIESGIDDIGSWWYRCPICHDQLEYKQKKCEYCGENIEWDNTYKQDKDNV